MWKAKITQGPFPKHIPHPLPSFMRKNHNNKKFFSIFSDSLQFGGKRETKEDKWPRIFFRSKILVRLVSGEEAIGWRGGGRAAARCRWSWGWPSCLPWPWRWSLGRPSSKQNTTGTGVSYVKHYWINVHAISLTIISKIIVIRAPTW